MLALVAAVGDAAPVIDRALVVLCNLVAACPEGQGRSQAKLAPGSGIMYVGVFVFREQCRTIIVTKFAQIHRGQLTLTAKRSFAPA